MKTYNSNQLKSRLDISDALLFHPKVKEMLLREVEYWKIKRITVVNDKEDPVTNRALSLLRCFGETFCDNAECAVSVKQIAEEVEDCVRYKMYITNKGEGYLFWVKTEDDSISYTKEHHILVEMDGLMYG